MTEQETIIDHLKDVFHTFESGLNGLAGTSMHDFQKRSFETLKQVQFPDRKHEDWKYTSVQKLITPKYNLASHQPSVHFRHIAGLESYVISIINGKTDLKDLNPALAEMGVKLIPLHEAFENQSWKEIFSKWLQVGDVSANRAFEFLNFSFNSAGFYLDVPKNTIVDKPIEIRFVHDEPETSFSHPLFFIRCGSGSKLQIFERFESNQSGFSAASDSLINSVGYIHIEKNAAVTHFKWQDLPMAQHLVYKLMISQYRDSRFEMFAFDRGGQLVRNNVEVELEENNTYTSLQAGYFASGKQTMDHQTRINHKVAYCESHELYKGIIDGQSTGAFNGKVFVHKDAQKTNAYQQNDTLVLSPYALMNSKPQLEIYADDVKCSHGATIGQLDEKSMFYLRSRGIDPQTAKHMLKEAFLAEILEKIPNEAIKDFIISQMSVGE